MGTRLHGCSLRSHNVSACTGNCTPEVDISDTFPALQHAKACKFVFFTCLFHFSTYIYAQLYLLPCMQLMLDLPTLPTIFLLCIHAVASTAFYVSAAQHGILLAIVRVGGWVRSRPCCCSGMSTSGFLSCLDRYLQFVQFYLHLNLPPATYFTHLLIIIHASERCC